jgi:hypothetical protein
MLVMRGRGIPAQASQFDSRIRLIAASTSPDLSWRSVTPKVFIPNGTCGGTGDLGMKGDEGDFRMRIRSAWFSSGMPRPQGVS